MASCLGLYVEEYSIKYAKVSKDRDKIKVESFGIKFYENKIGEAIDQIIEETYSQRTPISVNLSKERYEYFEMFAFLTKNDLQKAVKTEFDVFCEEKGYNPNEFETRYAIVGSQLDKDRIKVVHVSDNKLELNKRKQLFKSYKLSNLSPIAMSIPNLAKIDKNENSIIVNMEEQTSITKIVNGKVSSVEIMDEGSQDVLSRINIKENSYSKSYEICKNTTIYTSEGKELQETDTSYLEDIMPTLYAIVGQVKKTINSDTEKFDKVYITGTLLLINNADLYFQEYLPETKCEILKPYFIQEVKDISIKDYIEVNSAISIALMGLQVGISGMNFKNQTFGDKVPDWLKIDVNPEESKKEKKYLGGFFTWDLNQKFDKTEKGLARVALFLFLLIMIYSGFSVMLKNAMDNKMAEANNSISETNKQINLAKADDEKIKTKTNNYTTLIKNLEDANDRITDRTKTRNAIPNLLNQIMSTIPASVQIVSIENTSGTRVVINAQSSKYEQLGYFIAAIKTSPILTNVISTSGQKDNDVVTIRIEGDLP